MMVPSTSTLLDTVCGGIAQCPAASQCFYKA